jgi:hypothetical protein
MNNGGPASNAITSNMNVKRTPRGKIDANYRLPDWLPLAQKASKNMTLDTGFQTDQPAVGPAIFQNLTDDLKVTWSLTWIFTLAQERAFQQWLRSPTISTGA